MLIGGKQTIRPYIARLPETASFKILIGKCDGVVVSDSLAGNLA